MICEHYRRKPEWLKVRIPGSGNFSHVMAVLSSHRLDTICRQAKCPNIAECFRSGTATFLILGNTCTRDCLYCNVQHGNPCNPDETEPQRVACAVCDLGLDYVVITSVTRDDLPDGGAGIFSRAVVEIRKVRPNCKIEVLIPDFNGNVAALEAITLSEPDIINHNMEVVEKFFGHLRPQGNYQLSLKVLRNIQHAGIITKSGFMIGFGEGRADISRLMEDLAGVNCNLLTIGQYQQPTYGHWPVKKYYSPVEFADLKKEALSLGFKAVESGPLVRSSYRAAAMVRGAGMLR